jgi:hypothetical protein
VAKSAALSAPQETVHDLVPDKWGDDRDFCRRIEEPDIVGRADTLYKKPGYSM